MRLPHWLLRLFPMWDYLCPKCKREVSRKVNKCPHCGEKFPFPVRVPPRISKDQKALSDYVHKKIFPRIASWQREYLARFFTELFNDHFENDFTPWTGNTSGTSIVTSPVHHGSKAMQAASGSWVERYAYKNYDTGYTTIYARIYVRFESDPSAWTSIYFLKLRDKDGSEFARVGLEVGSPPADYRRWRLQYYDGGSEYAVLSDWLTIATATWHCLEMKVVRATSGEYRVYFNDTEVITVTGKDNTAQGTDIDQIRVGIVHSTASSSFGNVHVECVVVADAYIGEEAAGATYTKTWSQDVLFKKLGITKTLAVDVAIQKPDIAKTFSIDAAIKKPDIQIQRQVDALFKKLDILETFGIDTALLKKDIIKTFAVDARFGAVAYMISRQIDALFKKLDISKTFGIDAWFGEVGAVTYTKTLGIDVIFAYKVKLPQVWITASGEIIIPTKREVWVKA